MTGDAIFAADAMLVANVIIMVFPLLEIVVFWN
jgi:hypothetical protein